MKPVIYVANVSEDDATAEPVGNEAYMKLKAFAEMIASLRKLLASDIKRIIDVVTERKSIEKFSRVVSKEEIRNNDYNLNIPRYVDSSEDAEYYDIFATVSGGIPAPEVEKFESYWNTFPTLKNELLLYNSAEVSGTKLKAEILSCVNLSRINEAEAMFSETSDELCPAPFR